MSSDQPLLTKEGDDAASASILKRPSVLYSTASYILVTEFCERLCYYGFSGSLVLFFETQLNMSAEDSVNNFYLWNGSVYVFPLLGAVIADGVLGRYKTILSFSILYFISLVIFLFGIIPGNVQPPLVFLGMYLLAVATGGIKPNVSTLGADQFSPQLYEQDLKESKVFFSYFYWCINLGSLLSYTVIAYICQFGLPGLGGKEYSFLVGYSIPAIMILIGIAVFISGSSRYKKNSPAGSMITVICGIICEALYKRSYWTNLNNFTSVAGSKQDVSDDQQYVGELAGVATWLDVSLRSNGGSYSFKHVEATKYLVRLVPFLLLMVPFWSIYGQTKTAFQLQGCQMNTSIGSGVDIPISAMNIFNNITILALVPVFERYLYPAIERNNIEFGMLRKIGLGFVFACVAMVFAGIVEIARVRATPDAGNYYDVNARDNISSCKDINNYNPYQYQKWYADSNEMQPVNCYQTCDTLNSDDHAYLSLDCIQCDDIPQASSLSILVQVPLFVLIGIAEIFASVTSLEFFYSQAPNSIRSVSQACNLLTTALGSWLTIPFTLLVNSNSNDQWIVSNVDEGHLDYYFFLLASLMLVALLVFMRISRGFHMADPVILLKLSDSDE